LTCACNFVPVAFGLENFVRLEEMSRRALDSERPRPALRFNGRWRDWGWVHDYAASVSSALGACGVFDPAEIAFVPRNRPGSAAALLSLMEQGRTLFMVYAFQTPQALAVNLRTLGKRALVISRGDFVGPVVEAVRSMGAGVVLLDEDCAAPIAAAGGGAETQDATRESDPGIHVLTSGTTGAPKHFRLPYRVIAEHVRTASLMYGKPADPSKPALATLTYFPFANISGLYHLLPVLMTANPAILLEKFDIQAWLDYMKEYRPRVGSLPPPGIQMALEAGFTRDDLEGTEFINTGAAAVDPTLHRIFEERFGITLLMSYGATEFGGPVAYFTADLHRKWGKNKFGSVGPAWNGAALRVVDSKTGAVLPPNTEGLLEVIAPRIGPDWIRTTDLALLDKDGFMFHRGRADGAIMRGGFKLSPALIENALVLHPRVAAASVVGISEPRLGEVPVAAIQLRGGQTAPPLAELTEHLRKHLYATHVPVAFRFVDELPRTVSMKVDLRKVRALFEHSVLAADDGQRQAQDGTK
jgi:acyl-coenzyme A synthetase/AMP-(fatty) acid ligase